MTHEQFNQILEQRFTKTRNIMNKKSAEYATDNDKLHNFKKAARRLDCSPAMALRGMLEKHLVSVDDMIVSGCQPDEAWIDEKIGDVINYYHLLEGIWKENL